MSSQDNVCNFCGRTFSRYHNLLTHVENSHLNTSCYCEICDKRFGSPASIQFHLSQGHNRYGQSLPECDICGRIFSSKQNIKIHMLAVHLDVDKPEIYCNICSKSFTTPRNLRRHIEQLHNPNFEHLSCDICKKTFKGKHSVVKHVQTVHSASKDLAKCSQCSRVYTNKRNLKRHIEINHVKKCEYKCVLCLKVYTSNQSLKRHLQLHAAGKIDSYSCKFGSKPHARTSKDSLKTNSSEQFSIHLLESHNNKVSIKDGDANVYYKCQQCNIFLDDQHKLDQHNLDHLIRAATVKPPPSPRCIVCAKDFSSRKNLKRHIKHFHKDLDETELANFGTRRRSFNVECQDCIDNFADDYYYNIYQNLKHIPESVIFKCETCKSSYKCFEFAVQRYKQNYDIIKSKLYVSELCTVEMSEGSQVTPKEMEDESTREVQQLPPENTTGNLNNESSEQTIKIIKVKKEPHEDGLDWLTESMTTVIKVKVEPQENTLDSEMEGLDVLTKSSVQVAKADFTTTCTVKAERDSP